MNAVETMFSVREKPWHYNETKDVTKIIQTAPTSADALRLAGLDWECEKIPDFYKGRDVGRYWIVRTKDDSPLGNVGSQYTIVQNKDAFAFTDALIGDGVTYETAGSLKEGRVVWLLAKMPERFICGDKVEPYLCFTNSHDGTGAVRVCMTPVRVVCNNTLNMALSQAVRSWSTPHKGDVQGRIAEARQTLQLAEEYMTALDEQADCLANEKFDEGQIVSVVNALFPIVESMSERQKRTAKDAQDGIIACTFAPDLIQFAGTKWGFINAVADYVDHAEPNRRTSTFEERRWGKIMTGHPILDKAVALTCAAK